MDITSLVAQQTLARAFGSEKDNELKVIRQVHAQTMQREGRETLYAKHQSKCTEGCAGARTIAEMCYVGKQAARLDATADGEVIDK